MLLRVSKKTQRPLVGQESLTAEYPAALEPTEEEHEDGGTVEYVEEHQKICFHTTPGYVPVPCNIPDSGCGDRLQL